MIGLLLNLLFGSPLTGIAPLIVLVLSILALRRRARWTIATGAFLFTLAAFLFFAFGSFGWSIARDAYGSVQGATSAPKGRCQKSFTGFAAAPNTELNDNETDRGSKACYQSYPVYGKKERSYH